MPSRCRACRVRTMPSRTPGEVKVGGQPHRFPVGLLGSGEPVLHLAGVAQQTVGIGRGLRLDRSLQDRLGPGVAAGAHQLGCLLVAGVGEDRVRVLGGGGGRQEHDSREDSRQEATPGGRQACPWVATVHGV